MWSAYILKNMDSKYKWKSGFIAKRKLDDHNNGFNTSLTIERSGWLKISKYSIWTIYN